MPVASNPQIKLRMQRQRRTRTAPEMAVRRHLHARGFRYRVDASLPLAGIRRRADILFTRAQVAVFVDGCFWHSCPQHGTTPKSNREWWVTKLAANVARDAGTDRRLADSGWISLRIWEHEDPGDAAERVAQIVRTRVPHLDRQRG